MLYSEKTFKMKVRSRWTIFEILLMSAVICKSFAWKKDYQYLQTCKRHKVDQGYSKTLLWSFTSYI